uniref:FtsX-like permease family protein n=1 Tax=Actinomyces sp. 186855 TaxID=2761164 RepID=UPI00202E7944
MPSLLDLRRTLAAFVAVALSAALIAVALILTASFTAQVTATARASVGDADLVLLPPRGQELPADVARTAAEVEGVAAARPLLEQLMHIDRPGDGYDTHAFALLAPEPAAVSGEPTAPATGSTDGAPPGTPSTTGDAPRLIEGRLPTAPGEVAVSPVLARSNNVRVGDTIPLNANLHDTRSTVSAVSVVGVLEPAASMTRFGVQESYVLTTAQGWSSLGLSEVPVAVYLTVQDGASTDAVTAALQHRYGDSVDVYTASEIASLRAQNNNALTSATLELLNLLAPVCAVVAVIVIATTFTTLVAHQTRQTGLLRCVGASRAQVRRLVLRTALGTGLAGSVLGAALGAGAALAASRLGLVEGLSAEHLTVTWRSLALAVGLSTAATVLAALRPAVQAGRVSPLIALTGKVAEDRRLSRRRVVTAAVGLVVATAGGAVLVAGVLTRTIEIMAVGSVALVVGVLVALPLVVVLVAGAVERPARRHPVAHLACRNLARNPGRTAATTASLLVSVVVAVTMLTAMASINASMAGYLASGNPMDLRVDGVGAEQDVAALTRQVERIEGVEQVAVVPSLTVQVSSTAGSDEFVVHSVDRQALAPVVRSQHGLEHLDDSTLVLGGIYLIPDGTRVILTGPAGSVTLTAHVEEGGFGPVISPAVAAQLYGDSPTEVSLWARTSGDGASTAPAEALREQLHGTGLLVTGSADGRVAFTSQIWGTIRQVGAVLLLAVLISLVGLANTTEVSVLERTREIGVLRATGADRRLVRGLFLTEAVLTTLLGGVIGVVLGVLMGQAGVAGLMGGGGGE